MAPHRHLKTRQGYYYFRMGVPTELIPYLKRKEIVYSLNTTSLAEALDLCIVLKSAAYTLFERFKMPTALPSPMTDDQIKAFIKRYFDSCRRRFDDYRSRTSNNRFDLEATKYETRPGATKTIAAAVDEVLGVRISATRDPLFAMVDHAVESNGYTINNESQEYKALARHIEEVRGMVQKLCTNYHNGDSTDIRHRWLIDQAPALSTTAARPATVSLEPVTIDGLKAINESYITELVDADRKTKIKKRVTFLLWLEIVGVKALHTYVKQDGLAFKQGLLKLPANAKQRYPNKTTQELLAMSIPDDQKMHPRTVNAYMKDVRTFFEWATRNGLYSGENPLNQLDLDVRRDREARVPFSDEQLQKIFNSPVYKGCRSEGRRTQPGDKIIKDSLYWVPLIAVYTGARLNEICQLYVSDIKEQEGVWVIDINDNGEDKKIKTEDGIRLVPIHDALLEAGLLAYREQCQRANQTRLFSDIPMAVGDDTYSSVFSKRFATFSKAIGAKTANTSFHSFRHNVVRKLKSALVHITQVKAIVGHVDDDTTSGYGGGQPLPALKHVIQKLDYSSIQALKELTPNAYSTSQQ